MRTAHQQEVGRLTSDLEDETNVRYSMDRRIADLRKEVLLLGSMCYLNILDPTHLKHDIISLHQLEE